MEDFKQIEDLIAEVQKVSKRGALSLRWQLLWVKFLYRIEKRLEKWFKKSK